MSRLFKYLIFVVMIVLFFSVVYSHPPGRPPTSIGSMLANLTLTSRTSAPSAPSENVVYLADCSTWNPAGISCSEPYLTTYCSDCGAGSTAKWHAVLEFPNSMVAESVETPSFAHFTNADALYSDNTSPHVLIDSETKNTILTNCGATGDKVYTMPAYSHGMYFEMAVCAAYQMDLEPPSGGRIWLNGTQAAVDEHIINAGDTKPESMACRSMETSNDTYELFCESKYTNWAEATP